MAISKILHMKDTGMSFHGKHLKSSIEYILNSEKTQQGRLVGAINCQADNAFIQMRETKRHFNKIDKRQGYHLILSFKENEADADTAYKLTEEFVKEFIGSQYEAVYAVHDNTEHIHSHIIFNSVSFMDGRKYCYEKGDWAKIIQPITNRLCEKYGLSILDIEEEQSATRNQESRKYREWNDLRDGKFVWSDMIKRDVNACIVQAVDYDMFVELMADKGYEIKTGKYMAVRPMGMNRFRRLNTLGDDYTKEAIIERIKSENLTLYGDVIKTDDPKIITCYVKRYKRAKLSGIQKKYYAKLYRIGKLKKKAYSVAWKYKDDIKKMNKLQQEYLFLANHNIHNVNELAATIANLTDKKKEANREKSRVYRDKQKCKSLFDIAGEIKELSSANKAYLSGDDFFRDEHEQWEALNNKLKEQGYSYKEVAELMKYYKMQIADKKAVETAITKEIKLGNAILNELLDTNDVKTIEQTIKTEKEKIRDDGRKQPVR